MKKNLLIVFILTLIFLFYIWIITIGNEPWDQRFHSGWYNVLSDALLKGKLYFLEEFNPQILKLKDPYEPHLNAPLNRFNDMSLYKGKYYMYFGVVPAILLFIPYRLITCHILPERAAIIFFMFGGLIWHVLILSYIKRKYFPELPNYFFLASILVLGLGNYSTTLLRRPMMYEVAISGGFYFLSGAIFFFIKSFEHNKINIFFLVLGSLFIGLGAGCRPEIILSGLLLLLLIIKISLSNTNKKSKIISFLCLLIPYVICSLLLGLYNYLRFENPFDPGHQWQTNDSNPRKTIFISPIFTLVNAYIYLFQPIIFNLRPPFIHMTRNIPQELCASNHYSEGVVGIINETPFVLILLIGPLFYLLSRFSNESFTIKRNSILITSIIGTILFCSLLSLKTPYLLFGTYIFLLLISLQTTILIIKTEPSTQKTLTKNQQFPSLELFIIAIPLLLNFTVLLLHKMATSRYVLNFSTYLILFNCIMWFYYSSILSKNHKTYKAFNLIALFLIAISILFGVAFGIEMFLNR